MSASRRLIVASVAGIGLVCGLASVSSLLQERQRAREAEARRSADQQKAEAQRALRETMVRELEQNGKISAQTSLASLESMGTGSVEKMKDDPALAEFNQACADYRESMLREGEKYVHFIEKVDAEKPLDFALVKSKDQIAHRRELAHEMMDRLSAIDRLLDQFIERTTEDALHHGMSAQQIGKMQKPLREKYDAGPGDLHRIQEKVAAAILELCDLMEAEWGHWEMRGPYMWLQSDAATEKYDTIMEAARKAQEEYAARQIQLLKANTKK